MTVTDIGFVEVTGALEPRALAAGIATDAHKRVAEALALTIDNLEEDDNPLNQTQKIQFLEVALRCMDGFEREVLETLVGEIDRARGAGS